MTNYGAIPTLSNLDSNSATNKPKRFGWAAKRQAKVMFDFKSMNLPHGFIDAISRIKTNLYYFRFNYTSNVIDILFISLLLHLTSLVVLLIMVFFWVLLSYFKNIPPLGVFGYQIGDGTFIIVYSALTVGLLLFTHATTNILVALSLGAVWILIHATVRKTDDMFSEEQEAASFSRLTSS